MTTDPASAPAESATTEVTAPPGRSIAAPPKLAQPGRSRRRGMLALMIVTIVIGALGAGFFVNRSAVKLRSWDLPTTSPGARSSHPRT